MQIKGNQTAAAFILHPVVPAPPRHIIQPVHMPAEHFSQPLRFHGFLQKFVFRPKAQHLGDHKLHPTGAGSLILPLDICDLQAGGFLTQHMAALFHGPHRVFAVQISGQADIHDIQRLLAHHLIKIRIPHRSCLFHGRDQLSGTDIAHRRNFRLRKVQPAVYMSATDTAQPDHSHFKHEPPPPFESAFPDSPVLPGYHESVLRPRFPARWSDPRYSPARSARE